MCLRNSALQMTQHRLTTKKKESIYRSFSASMPNTVKFRRNAHRVCLVIDCVNYGAGNSMLQKLENIHYPRSGQVARPIIYAPAYPSCQGKANAELPWCKKKRSSRNQKQQQLS